MNNNKELARESENIIKEVRKDICSYILIVLQSVIKEQISIRQLRREVGSYVYDAVKD